MTDTKLDMSVVDTLVAGLLDDTDGSTGASIAQRELSAEARYAFAVASTETASRYRRWLRCDWRSDNGRDWLGAAWTVTPDAVARVQRSAERSASTDPFKYVLRAISQDAYRLVRCGRVDHDRPVADLELLERAVPLELLDVTSPLDPENLAIGRVAATAILDRLVTSTGVTERDLAVWCGYADPPVDRNAKDAQRQRILRGRNHPSVQQEAKQWL